MSDSDSDSPPPPPQPLQPAAPAAHVQPPVSAPTTPRAPASPAPQAAAAAVRASPSPAPAAASIAGVSPAPGQSTTAALTSALQQALAKGDLSRSLESLSSLLSLSGDNRLKHDLLLKLVELTRHFAPSLALVAPAHALPLLRCLRLLLVDKEPTLRSQALRVLRYLLSDWLMLSHMLSLNLDLLIVRSLERESKFLWERMQALKFVRKWMAMSATAQAATKGKQTPAAAAAAAALPQHPPIDLTRSLVQSLVSIAEQPKDDFRRVCLDAIRELTLLSPGIVASCNGIRTLVDSILDPACVDIASSLTLTLLYLIDSEESRQFLRPSVDLVRLISVFTDMSASDNPERENRRAAAHKAVVMLMRSWTGILCLTADPACLRALIGLLHLPPSIKGGSWARETIFDMLFEVIHVVKAQDVRAMGQRIRSSMAAAAISHGAPPPAKLQGPAVNMSSSCSVAYPPNLLHSYMVMLLLSFLSCDLVEILTQLAQSQDREFAHVAAKLLVEIMGLSAELLPPHLCAKLHALRNVVGCAANFDDCSGMITAGGGASGGGSSSAAEAGADGGGLGARVRAVNLLSGLHNGELHFMGVAAHNGGFGVGNALAAGAQAPGVGWGWMGPLHVNWEASFHAAAAAAAASNSAASNRDSHDWSAPAFGRQPSFSRGARNDAGGGGFGDDLSGSAFQTPTGRRQVIHGIRIERLAMRCDLAPLPARLVSAGAYGSSLQSNADVLASSACITSQAGVLARQRMRSRLAQFSRSQLSVAAHGGAHAPAALYASAASIVGASGPGSSPSSSTPAGGSSSSVSGSNSDFHLEEFELSPFLKKSNVLSTKDWKQWDWDLVSTIVERFMLASPSHTAYLVLRTKFPKRLLSFLRSDKHHFVDMEWNPYHVGRYAKIGVGLLKAIAACTEGREYSWTVELVDAIFLAILFEIEKPAGKESGSAGGPIPPSPHSLAVPQGEPAVQIAQRKLSHLSGGLSKAKAGVFKCYARKDFTSKLSREYPLLLGILLQSGGSWAWGFVAKYEFLEVLTNLGRDPSKDYITKLMVANLPFWSCPPSGVSAESKKHLRKILEGWLAPPSPGAQSGNGCSWAMRYWIVEHLLIWWRRHQAQLGSQLMAQEMEATGAGMVGSGIPGIPGTLASAQVGLAAATIVGNANLISPAALTSAQNDSHDASAWMVGLLVSQLALPDLNLRAAVLNALEEMCVADPHALQVLISRKPVILRELSAMRLPSVSAPSGAAPAYPAAHRILNLFLSCKPGFEFLRAAAAGSADSSWLQTEFQEWKHTHGAASQTPGAAAPTQLVTYVRGLEEALIVALSSNKKDEGDVDHDDTFTTSGGSGGSGGATSKLDELSSPSLTTNTTTGANSQWNGPVLRSALDDLYFERLHALPWVAEITLESGSRRMDQMSECFVFTTSHHPASLSSNPQAALSASSIPQTRQPSGSEDMSASGASLASLASSPSSAELGASTGGAAPQTYIVCQLIDVDGTPRPQRIDSNVTIRVKLSVGAGVTSQNIQDVTSVPGTPGSNSASGAPADNMRNNNPRGRGGMSNGSSGASGSSGNYFALDGSSLFLEEREAEREWARTYFADVHASEYVLKPNARAGLSTEVPFVTAKGNGAEGLCNDDEARFNFEVPELPSAGAPHTHSSARGGVSGNSPAGTLTLESIWFPIPMPLSSIPSVTLLPHLFGELAKTQEGCAYLRDSKQIPELEKTIRDGGLSGSVAVEDAVTGAVISAPCVSSSLEKRAALWAIGHVGSSAYGFELLEQQAPGLVLYIAQQAISCTTLSMRGTCFYVLGLLGRSSPARAFLQSLGWCFSPFPGGCIAIPCGTPASAGTSSSASASTAAAALALATGAREQSQAEEGGLGAERARNSLFDADDEEDDDSMVAAPGQQLVLSSRSAPLASTVAPAAASSTIASPLLSSFLALSWPASAYCGSWATDPSNLYGINSSKRTRKAGEGGTSGAGGAPGGGGDADGAVGKAAPAAAVTTGGSSGGSKDDSLEVLSLSEGLEVILSHLSNLCNHVTQKASLQSLRAMKAAPQHAHLFAQPLLLFECFKLLSCYSYKLPARRFLFFDLFASVAFNMHTIAQFDEPFHAQNISSYAKQKAREIAAAATAAAAAATNQTPNTPASGTTSTPTPV